MIFNDKDIKEKMKDLEKEISRIKTAIDFSVRIENTPLGYPLYVPKSGYIERLNDKINLLLKYFSLSYQENCEEKLPRIRKIKK